MVRHLLAVALLGLLVAGCARNPDGSLVSVKPDQRLLAAFQSPTAPPQHFCLENYGIHRCTNW